MYWEGPQIDRPNERPYALHRNGYAGMQRYASFLWSGDVYSKWETLKTHIPDAINTGLSGIPYWGTDIGGFVPTKEFTPSCICAGFNLALFVRYFAVMEEIGNCACHGDGTPVIPGRWRSANMRARQFPMRSNCTIRRSSPFVENISTCDIECSPIFTALFANAR
jgi:hypothetical protein